MMKLTATFSALALSLPLLSYAMPATTESKVSDGVTCTVKYTGALVLEEKVGGARTPVGYVKNNDVTMLTVNPEQVNNQNSIFYFYECYSRQWNDYPQQYGVVQPMNEADAKNWQCVTNRNNMANIEKCSSFAQDLLGRQWFYANYLFDSDTSVRLTLNGNPNDKGNPYNLPYIYVSDDEAKSLTFSRNETSNGRTRYQLYIVQTDILSKKVKTSKVQKITL